MTLSNSNSSQTFIGNGATTIFNYVFVMGDPSWAQASYIDASGNVTTLTPGDYVLTVNAPGTAQAWGIGGTIAYTIAGNPIAPGTSLFLERIVPLIQTTSFINQGNFNPRALEQALDYDMMASEQIQAEQARSIQIPATDPPGLNVTTPSATLRAGLVLGFDAQGNVEMFTPTGITPTPPASTLPYGVATGTANVYMVTVSPALGLLTDGKTILIKIPVTNNNASTINVSGTGALAITNASNGPLSKGALAGGAFYMLTYSGSTGHWSASTAVTPAFVSVTQFGAVGDGTTDDSTAIHQADLSSSVVFDGGRTYRVSVNTTIATQATFRPGSKVIIDSGVTLTFTLPPQAGLYSIFTGVGIAKVNGASPVEWFGAVGDNSTDCRTPIALADISGPTIFSAGTYRIGSSITLSNCATFEAGAVASCDSGAVLTMLIPPEAPRVQIFTGNGTQRGGGMTEISVFNFMTAAQIADVVGRTVTADVTAAIRKAIIAVQGTGFVLRFPNGVYKVTGQLAPTASISIKGDGVYKNVTQGVMPPVGTVFACAFSTGVAASVWTANMSNGAFDMEGCEGYSTLQTIPGSGTYTPVTTPAFISLTSTVFVYSSKPTLKDIMIRNMTKGIIITGVNGCDIDGLWGQTLNVLLTLDGCGDVCHVRKVHYWVFWSDNVNLQAYNVNNAFGLDLGKVDNPTFVDCFFFGMYAAVQIRDSNGGVLPAGSVSLAQFAVLGCDNCTYGIIGTGTIYPTTLNVSNFYNFNSTQAGGGSNVVLSRGIWDGFGTQSMKITLGEAVFLGSDLEAISLTNPGSQCLLNNTRITGYNSHGGTTALVAATGAAFYIGTLYVDLAGGNSGAATGGAGTFNGTFFSGGTGSGVSSITGSNGVTVTPSTGSATASLTGINNGLILANFSGSNGIPPSGTSLLTIMATSIGTDTGSLATFNGMQWAELQPSATSGLVLSSNGTGAQLSWISVSGSGTVTNIATGNGITGGPITSTGTLGFATVSSGSILSNISGSTAIPTSHTLSALLDFALGTDKGALVARSTSVWSELLPTNTNGVLTAHGNGNLPTYDNNINISGGVIASAFAATGSTIGFSAGSGSYTTGLDLSSATISGQGIVLPNSKNLAWKNSVGSVVPGVVVNASNDLQLGGSGIGNVVFGNAGFVLANSDNVVTLGANGFRFTAVWAADGTIQTSDRRAKKNIKTSDLGLDFINSVKAVSYQLRDKKSDKDRHYGVIVDQIETVLDGRSFGGIRKADTSDGLDGLNYSELIGPLIKSVQELSAKIDAQAKHIAKLERRLA